MDNKKRLINAMKALPMTMEDKLEFADIVTSASSMDEGGGSKNVEVRYYSIVGEVTQEIITCIVMAGDIINGVICNQSTYIQELDSYKEENVEVKNLKATFSVIRHAIKFSIKTPSLYFVTQTRDGNSYYTLAGNVNNIEMAKGLILELFGDSIVEITKEEYYKDVDIKLEDWPSI